MSRKIIIAFFIITFILSGCKQKERNIEMGSLSEPKYKTTEAPATESNGYNRANIAFKDNKDCSVSYIAYDKAVLSTNYGLINFYLDYYLPGSDSSYEYNSFCTNYAKRDPDFQVTFVESNTEYDNTDTVHFKFISGSQKETSAISVCNENYSITVYSDELNTFGLLYEFTKLLVIQKKDSPDVFIDYINHVPDDVINIGFNIPDWTVAYSNESGLFIIDNNNDSLNNIGIAITSKCIEEDTAMLLPSNLPYKSSINYMEVYNKIYGFDIYFNTGIRKSDNTLIRTYGNQDFSIVMNEEISDSKTKLINDKYTVTSTHNTMKYTWGTEYGYSLFSPLGGDFFVDTFYIATSSDNYHAIFFYTESQKEYINEIENMFISSLY